MNAFLNSLGFSSISNISSIESKTNLSPASARSSSMYLSKSILIVGMICSPCVFLELLCCSIKIIIITFE